MRAILKIPYEGEPGYATEQQRRWLHNLCKEPGYIQRLGREMYQGSKSRMLWEVEADPLIMFVLAGEKDIEFIIQDENK